MRILALLLVSALASGFAQEEVESLRQIQLYDVRDLLDEPGSEKRVESERELLDVLRYALPGFEKRAEYQITKGSLIVQARPEDHQALRRQLESLRSGTGRQLLIECAMAWMPTELPKDTVEVAQDERTKKRFIEDARERGQVLSVPSIIVAGSQRAQVTTGNVRRFIRGYDLVRNVEGRETPLAVPQIEEIFEGLELRGRVVPAQDPAKLTLLLGVDVTKVASVEERATEHGPVHEPVVDRKAFSSHVSLSPGTSILVRTAGVPSPYFGGDAMGLALWVKVSRVEVGEDK